MKTLFLGQGYNIVTHRPVGQYIIDAINSKEYTVFTGISAFASDAAVKQLSEYLKESTLKSVNLIVGIDQKGTPKTALEEILKLNVNSFIFYQKEKPIFHPKIYLFEGNDKTLFIIGSSNLTETGLFSNIESSVLFEFNNNDEEGKILLNDLKLHYKTLFDFSDNNLFKITPEIIQYFVDEGIVPKKIDWSTINKKDEGNNKRTQNTIRLEIPKREIAKIPRKYIPKEKEIEKEIIAESGIDIDNNLDLKDLKLLWISNKLTIRDLSVKISDTTHPSSSMLFSKGQTKNIDQRHYFRDVVFRDANWIYDTAEKTKHYERAQVKFNIYIGRDFKGQFTLNIKHDTRTNTPSYRQKNSMTAVSWGTAKGIVSKIENLGKIAKLYSNPDIKNEFTLVIE